jgi:hypothetical protein
MDISFVIITGGEKADHIKRLLRSIRSQRIKNYESIIVGNVEDFCGGCFSSRDVIKISNIDAANKGPN